jgi:hypothetical protein
VQKLKVDGKEINSEAAISEVFCKFFADISTSNYTKTFPDEEIIIDPNNRMDNTKITSEEAVMLFQLGIDMVLNPSTYCLGSSLTGPVSIFPCGRD